MAHKSIAWINNRVLYHEALSWRFCQRKALILPYHLTLVVKEPAFGMYHMMRIACCMLPVCWFLDCNCWTWSWETLSVLRLEMQERHGAKQRVMVEMVQHQECQHLLLSAEPVTGGKNVKTDDSPPRGRQRMAVVEWLSGLVQLECNAHLARNVMIDDQCIYSRSKQPTANSVLLLVVLLQASE